MAAKYPIYFVPSCLTNYQDRVRIQQIMPPAFICLQSSGSSSTLCAVLQNIRWKSTVAWNYFLKNAAFFLLAKLKVFFTHWNVSEIRFLENRNPIWPGNKVPDTIFFYRCFTTTTVLIFHQTCFWFFCFIFSIGSKQPQKLEMRNNIFNSKDSKIWSLKTLFENNILVKKS